MIHKKVQATEAMSGPEDGDEFWGQLNRPYLSHPNPKINGRFHFVMRDPSDAELYVFVGDNGGFQLAQIDEEDEGRLHKTYVTEERLRKLASYWSNWSKNTDHHDR